MSNSSKMDCSVGKLVHEECHKKNYSRFSKIESYTKEEKDLIEWRLEETVTDICTYHKLKVLDLEICETYSHLKLVPGKSICTNCFKKLKEDKEAIYMDVDMIEEEFEGNDNEDSAFVFTEELKRSIGDKSRKLLRRYVLRPSIYLAKRNKENVDNLDQDYFELIDEVKKKISTVDYKNKINLISIAPKSWSREGTAKELNVSPNTVRTARQAMKNDGILPYIKNENKQGRHSLSKEMSEKIIQFYLENDISRPCPGAKEYVSVKDDNGNRIHMQKRLILSNLKEIYTFFKEQNPAAQIGFSKFAELRPKWCILAGASGTHTVCVCIYHQNLKLASNVISRTINYADYIKAAVCDINCEQCMMSECEQCPNEKGIDDFLSTIQESQPLAESVEYSQWISNDRCQMKTLNENYEEFMKNFKEQVLKTKPHHYISKKQSNFLRARKKNLAEHECMLQCDSFCVLSDTKTHSTLEFAIFQKRFVTLVKQKYPRLLKFIYMTDGCGGQYKNKKNFLNLYNHKRDFDIDAEWHFYATSHGKSACDGIGGTVKRLVRKASLQRENNNQILNINDIYKFCVEKIKTITFSLVIQEEINSEKPFFENNLNVLKTTTDEKAYIKGEKLHTSHGQILSEEDILLLMECENNRQNNSAPSTPTVYITEEPEFEVPLKAEETKIHTEEKIKAAQHKGNQDDDTNKNTIKNKIGNKAPANLIQVEKKKLRSGSTSSSNQK
ncbi:unnamed protein product [Ceutorhynchus assimilis]|uniref:Uncharacterized protein n=1 Tax=Ceutorhynchus assimilis TaxID=467358 RepID=A0A9N9MPD9_9CUCU|nr:unnamed protein product [Ceutorhynchus assimilis]